MTHQLPAHARLESELGRLQHDGLVVVPLDAIDDLVQEPDPDPFVARRSPRSAGIDDVAATLAAARRLPAELTVRVVTPAGAGAAHSEHEVEDALRRTAARTSADAWREAMAERATGRRQLPAGTVIAVMAWAAASVLGVLASSGDGAWAVVSAVGAGMSITVAWVASWWVVEGALLSWRTNARRAAIYDLLSRCRVEFVSDGGEGPPETHG